MRHYEVQSRKAVDDDLKMGVVILGTHDSLVKEHLMLNTRLDSWIKTRDEILEFAHSQRYVNTAIPFRLLLFFRFRRSSGLCRNRRLSGMKGLLGFSASRRTSRILVTACGQSSLVFIGSGIGP